MAQNTSAPLGLDLTERRIAIAHSITYLRCWSSQPAHRASSSQALKRRRHAPALRLPYLRGPFLLSSCCTSSACAGRCCRAPCSPSRPRLGVPSCRRTAGARVSPEIPAARTPVGSPSSSLSSHSVVSSNFTSLFNFCIFASYVNWMLSASASVGT